MTNQPKLSARASTALDILADGGSFRYGLERNSYTGREQFAWRLQTAGGSRVHGVGGAAYRELTGKGFAFKRTAAGFTGSAAYFHLDHGAV